MKTLFFLLFLVFSLLAKAQEKPEGPHIPLEKNLDAKWIKFLYNQGQQKVYKGEELDHIAMPYGGTGAGQVEITGSGNLRFTGSVYNKMQSANAGNG